MNKNLAESLKQLVDTTLDPALFPVKDGKIINIGSYSIKYYCGTYKIKSYKTGNIVASTYTKAAALAVAKMLNKNKSIDSILSLDDIAAKHRTDCIFYNHILEKTDNPIKFDSTLTRYDISMQKQEDAIEKIKQFIW